jgi:murein DD-endopeptidase MepM/ murein hydrolase activator NlpD
MVIPDANRQVVQLQMSAFWVIAALTAFAILMIAAFAAVILYGSRQAEVSQLKHKLAVSSGQYEQIISEKDKHIEDLQMEVAHLSVQAKSIQAKISDLNELENEIKEITGLETPATDASHNNPRTMAFSADAADGDTGGIGGEDLPLTEDYINRLLLMTQQHFSYLEGRIEELKPRLEETKDAVLKLQAKLAVTPNIWPTDSRRITSEFGVRRDPFTKRARFHAGIDIGGKIGDPVYAAADGTIISADRDSAHGKNIIISHGNGLKTRYSHLSKIIAEPGQKVKKGEIIGLMGSTGRSTGPHLHYEVIKNGSQVDPEQYLPSTRKES